MAIFNCYVSSPEGSTQVLLFFWVHILEMFFPSENAILHFADLCILWPWLRNPSKSTKEWDSLGTLGCQAQIWMLDTWWYLDLLEWKRRCNQQNGWMQPKFTGNTGHKSIPVWFVLGQIDHFAILTDSRQNSSHQRIWRENAWNGCVCK